MSRELFHLALAKAGISDVDVISIASDMYFTALEKTNYKNSIEPTSDQTVEGIAKGFKMYLEAMPDYRQILYMQKAFNNVTLKINCSELKAIKIKDNI